MAESLTFELRRVRLEGVTALRSVRESITDREVIIVSVTDSHGKIGWGECSALPRPGYVAEYLEGAWAVLRDVLIPGIVAAPGDPFEMIADVRGHQMARSALVGALLDHELRRRGESLARALATDIEPNERVSSNAVVGIFDDPDDLQAAVAASLEAGHRSVKIKIDPLHDVDAVRTIRSLWPDLPLAVDANGSYPDATVAAERLRSLEAAAGQLTYIEQPLMADDLVGTAVLSRQIDSPIALDESISTIGEATTALSLGALGVLNLKPARVGGPLEAVAIARLVAAEGCPIFCGGMVESGIGRAAALGIAAQPECTLPSDLGPSSRYHRCDITDPFVLDDGALGVPDGPGIGVEPDLDALRSHTVASCRI